MRRALLTLFTLAALTYLILPIVDETYSNAYRYLATYERPTGKAACQGRLDHLEVTTSAWTLTPLLAGTTPGPSNKQFASEVTNRLEQIGYYTFREDRDFHGDHLHIHLKHRYSNKERLLYVLFDRGGLKARHWCFFDLTWTQEHAQQKLQSPLDVCNHTGPRAPECTRL